MRMDHGLLMVGFRNGEMMGAGVNWGWGMWLWMWSEFGMRQSC